MAKSFLNNLKIARGLRNNNPGNLIRTSEKWLGKIPFAQSTDTKFEQFVELRWGIRAMMRDIISDIKKGNNTVPGLIHEYAPAIENNTPAYVSQVLKAVGLAADQIISLNEEMIISLCKIIVRVENGPDANLITDSDYTDAIAILGIPLKKKAVVTI
jgi:hypothetical protein